MGPGMMTHPEMCCKGSRHAKVLGGQNTPSGSVEVTVGWPASEPERSLGGVGLPTLGCRRFSASLSCSLFKGELYFMSTGVPSATAARGVIYKVIDPSR